MTSGGLLLVWGPPRSGTTWLFNVLKAMASVAGVPSASWVHGQPAPRVRTCGTLIAKSHQAHSLKFIENLGPDSNVHAIGIFRSPEAAFQSLIRTQRAERSQLLEWLEQDIDSITQGLHVVPGSRVIREEWVQNRADELVASLARSVGLPLTDEQCNGIASQFARERVAQQVAALASARGWSDDFEHYDANTHWHAGHIAPRDHKGVELTPTELERLAVLQARVDNLTEEFGLWTHTETASVPLSLGNGGQRFARSIRMHGRRSMWRLRRAASLAYEGASSES